MDGTPILFDDGNPDRVSVAEVLVEPLITAAAERVGAADWARALARGKQLSLADAANTALRALAETRH